MRISATSHRAALIEASANTASGFLVSVFVAYLMLPLWGLKPTIIDSFGITLMFTGVSVLRNYLWRRLFVRLHKNGVLK